jgi:hypothetical protein
LTRVDEKAEKWAARLVDKRVEKTVEMKVFESAAL